MEMSTIGRFYTASIVTRGSRHRSPGRLTNLLLLLDAKESDEIRERQKLGIVMCFVFERGQITVYVGN